MTSNKTNLQVWQYGEEVEHFPCDVDANGEHESNGSIEHVIDLDGLRYSVITDWYGNLRWPHEKAKQIHDDDE